MEIFKRICQGAIELIKEVKPTLTCRIRIAKELAEITENDEVLDVGCAWGYFESLALLGKVRWVIGLDISRKTIEFARAKFGDYFIRADAGKLPFASEKFNKVFLLDTLEHCYMEYEVLKEANRILKKGRTYSICSL